MNEFDIFYLIFHVNNGLCNKIYFYLRYCLIILYI